MPDLLMYGMYLDAREGASIAEITEEYDLPPDSVEERLTAAMHCFDRQVDHIEFSDDFLRAIGLVP